MVDEVVSSGRISVVNAAYSFVGMRAAFRVAAARDALTRAGFLPGDEDAEVAIAKGGDLLTDVLRRADTPLCKLAMYDNDSGIAALARHSLSWMQVVFCAAWEAETEPSRLLSVLRHSDRAVAALAACAAVKTWWGFSDLNDDRPKQTIASIEAWARGAATRQHAVEAADDAVRIHREDYDAGRTTIGMAARAAGYAIDGFMAFDDDAGLDKRAMVNAIRAVAACPELVPHPTFG